MWSAINVIVEESRVGGGTRKVVSIGEVLGYDGERVQLQDIFVFKQTGVDGDGHVLGQLTPTGVIPQCLEHLTASGEGLDISIFAPQRPAVVAGGALAHAGAGDSPDRARQRADGGDG